MTERSAGTVTIVGAGLCGSLLAIMLGRRGFDVSVLERQPDPRGGAAAAGRSINLALSARGMRAMQGAGVFAEVEPLLMPMRGRLIHDEDGSTEMQPYGQRQDEQIYSVSRAALNRILIDAAEQVPNVELKFEQEATAFDPERGELQMLDCSTNRVYSLQRRPVIAADGAGSAIRRRLQVAAGIDVEESLLPHGYKELGIPPLQSGRHRLDPGALHIWPRGGFMLIALPNPAGDFTLTLFLSNNGEESFAALRCAADVEAFFDRHFADVAPFIPDLAASFMAHPVGILGTVRCRPWHVGGSVLLIGDAAHAIVPFHGQGMNLAFEDCVLLERLLRERHCWDAAFAAFEAEQRDNADAIADMALENYVEMRDTVRDPKFKLRKALSFELERRLPDRFIPRYSMVMFHDEIPYAVAQQRGALQHQLLEDLMRGAERLEDIDLDRAANLARETLSPLRKNP